MTGFHAAVSAQIQVPAFFCSDHADVFGRERVTITGKLNDKQDDLLIAVMMTLFWGRSIVNDPRRLARL